MKKYFKNLDHNCRIKNITNETLSKEGQENMELIQKEKNNIQEISNNFSNKLNESIEEWDNLRNIFMNKSNDYHQKQNNLILNKYEYLKINNNLNIKNNKKAILQGIFLLFKISLIVYIMTLVYQFL
ncbi:hypothetical protein BCR36DRAFT_68087 [Piromyces finnis]|uniref:Uncharacterized protein n=1 Tax=Piromyces finnis TaxID=1754191 RepID=A0A1Y1V806_9FUNG|nr:hypothetical protein BCR36DRAFT_68087 [Piromyces finnis]|eukprot:ORX49320.1 hypothetical protein BCR36DRAFT_68087 [Piromyces finnis]